MSTIKEPVLRELVQAAAVVGATVTGQDKGFSVMIHVGNSGEKTLATTRGAIRVFASLDTAGAFVRNIGLPRFYVDMSHHEPGRLRKARPDRAEALRHTRTRMQQQDIEFLPIGERQ
ncbi:MAG: hypothetical protein WBX38_02285 [Candidatus Sulfotelmatobacter sp.]